LVMVRPPATVSVNALVAVTLLASATCTVKLAVPLAVGVPLMAPVLPFSNIPAGSDPTVMDQV